MEYASKLCIIATWSNYLKIKEKKRIGKEIENQRHETINRDEKQYKKQQILCNIFLKVEYIHSHVEYIILSWLENYCILITLCSYHGLPLHPV